MPITATKVKKGGLQQYRVRVNFTDADGRYRQVERTAYGKSEAIAMERELMHQVESKQVGGVTFAELLEKYLQDAKQRLAISTYSKLKRTMEMYGTPLLGQKRISEIDQAAILDWKDYIGQQDLALATQKNYFVSLHGIFSFAVKRGLISANPMANVDNFTNRAEEIKSTEDVLHYYTIEEYSRYIAVARRRAESDNTISEWGMYVFFCIAYYTGLRKGEIHGLRWSDLDDAGMLHVRRSISQKRTVEGGGDIVGPPKNKSSYRTIQMPRTLIMILNEHRMRQQLLPDWHQDLLVCSGTDKSLRDMTLERRNRSYAKSADLPHIRIHDFRHSHASLLCNNGINIQQIAKRLGHSNVQRTWQTYSHMYPREDERAVHVLDDLTMEIAEREADEKSPNLKK